MKGISRRSFVTGSAVAALGGTLALIGCAPNAHGPGGKSGTMADGAWVGTGIGKHGEMTVEVVTKDNAIDRMQS
mgnify:CR=1 FL=1